MSATLASTLLNITAQSTVTEGSSNYSPKQTTSEALAPGTSNSQCDLVYQKTRSVVASGTPLDIDLQALNWNGNDATSAAVEIVAIYVKNTNAAQKLTIGGGTNPFTAWMTGTTPTMDVGKSSRLYRDNPVDGWAVNGSAKTLRFVTDSATAHSFELFILARSA